MNDSTESNTYRKCNITIKFREQGLINEQNPALFVIFARYGSDSKILRKAIFWCVYQTRREDENPNFKYPVVFYLRIISDFRLTYYCISRVSVYHGVQEAFT